jgi:hypothetical protein
MLLDLIISVATFSLFTSMIGVCLDEAGHKAGVPIMIATITAFGMAVSALPFAV